jgi:hypothetical protein
VDEDPDYQSDLTKIRSALRKSQESLGVTHRAVELAQATVKDLQQLISDECLALEAEAQATPGARSRNDATQRSQGSNP